MRYISLSDQFGDDNKNDENEYLLKFPITDACESMHRLNTKTYLNTLIQNIKIQFSTCTLGLSVFQKRS